MNKNNKGSNAMSRKFMTDEMVLNAYSRHYTEPPTSVAVLTNVLVHEGESSTTFNHRLNQLEVDFVNSAAQERTVQHPSVIKFIRAARLEGDAWEEIAKDVEAIFGLARSERTMRRAMSGRS
jgi:hypothetical protein